MLMLKLYNGLMFCMLCWKSIDFVTRECRKSKIIDEMIELYRETFYFVTSNDRKYRF